MADFNGDGCQDLITGCFEGGSYLMFGSEDRTFRAPVAVLDRSGKPLRVGQYWDDVARKWAADDKELGIAATPVDWDADGDQDLLLGSSEGHFWLSRNEGTPHEPVFSEALVRIDAGGAPLEVASRHAMPVVADWDGDGHWDLLSGTAAGGVVWFRNAGKTGAPAFEPARELVPRADGKWENPGMRTQVAVADFDDDGRLDLLLGDYRSRSNVDAKNKREYHGWVWLYRRSPAAQAGSGQDGR